MQLHGFVVGAGDLLLIRDELFFVGACVMVAGQTGLIGNLGARVGQVTPTAWEWRKLAETIRVTLDGGEVLRMPAIWHSRPHDHWVVVEK